MKDNGHAISTRGRIPTEVADAFPRSHRDLTKPAISPARPPMSGGLRL